MKVRRSLQPMLILLLVAASAACGGGRPAEGGIGNGEADGADSLFSRGALVIETNRGLVELAVEIAETQEARATGLMGRESLPDDAGMVFLETQPVRQSFWMKDTLIPLSIAFWDERNEILAILDMDPCETDPCPTYDPGVAWTGAVEVNQGFFDEHRVKVGDEVRLEREG